MQCSARKFLASQALYGAQIAHPDWTHEQLINEAVELSSGLIDALDNPKRRKTALIENLMAMHGPVYRNAEPVKINYERQRKSFSKRAQYG